MSDALKASVWNPDRKKALVTANQFKLVSWNRQEPEKNQALFYEVNFFFKTKSNNGTTANAKPDSCTLDKCVGRAFLFYITLCIREDK